MDRLEKPRIDGVLKEWPGSATPLTEKVKGSARARAEGRVGYDARFLYLAFEVRDAELYRTASAGMGEDHGTLVLDVPQRGGGKTQLTIDVFPGVPGKSAGLLKLGGSKVGSAEVVEAADADGWIVEARVPWSALPGTNTLRVGLRAELRVTDGSAKGGAGVLGCGKRPLFGEAEYSLWQTVLEPNRLGAEPAREVYGNVWGDAALERVALFGGRLVILGERFKKGKEFYFKDLALADPALVSRLELRDMDGDGLDELLLQYRTDRDEYREVIEILKVSGAGSAERAYAHELAIVTREGRIQNQLKITTEGGTPVLEIRQGEEEGFESASFREPPHAGMASALLPWESIESRKVKWDGSAYAVAKETRWTPKKKAAPKGKRFAHAPGPPGHARTKSAETAGGADTRGSEGAAPAPRPPSSEELLDQVYALYRKERKREKSTPRFDFVTNVTGGADVERVLVHGKDVVVFGKGYRSGTSYAFIEVGVAAPEDVLDVTARDLTGDGRAEVIVRARLLAKAGKELKDEPVTRDVLFVYRVSEQGLERVFAAETGRAMGNKRVIAAVSFVPRGKGTAIELRPSRAVGWTQKTYPFPEDAPSGKPGQLEPLVAPWGTKRAYSFGNGAFVLSQ
jgi:hypothetical protein